MAALVRAALAMAIALTTTGTSPSAARAEPGRTALAMDLVTRLARKDPTANVMISPFSLTAVLAMLETGAGGDTRDKLRAALGVKGDKETARFREGERAVLGELRRTEPLVVLQTANGVWNSPRLPIKPAFAAALRADFDAPTTPLDFTRPEALATVNRWVRDKTRGAIPVLVSDLPKETLLVLANAVYFKAKWSAAFDPAETRQAPFTRADGAQQPAFLMSRKGKFQYLENAAGQAVRLPYGDGRFTMTLLLPREGNAPPDLAQILRADLYKPSQGTVALPRLKFDMLLRLADVLGEVGLGGLFSDNADYRGIATAGFHPTQVVQRVAVTVEETGTEAAAATAGLVERSGSDARAFTMICDRPFYFVIDDAKTGAALFAAHVGDPS
jgi:serine protease inhibitor